jgi:hypothetical protein
MNGRTLTAAAIAVITIILLYAWLPAREADAADPAPLGVRAAAATPSPAAPPAPLETARAGAEVADDFPATISLDDGPPPLRLYRCAVYARLLGDNKPAAEAAPIRAVAAELDAVIALLRETRAAIRDPAAPDLGTPADTPDPDVVRETEMARARQVGPRLVEWLEDSYARCDQEIVWAHGLTGRVPVTSPAGS